MGERKRVRELVWVVGLYLPGNSSKAIEPPETCGEMRLGWRCHGLYLEVCT